VRSMPIVITESRVASTGERGDRLGGQSDLKKSLSTLVSMLAARRFGRAVWPAIVPGSLWNGDRPIAVEADIGDYPRPVPASSKRETFAGSSPCLPLNVPRRP
jgi:hypothetical protein